MATYKVIQDVEAEDTLIGPLTLRQCIYAAIAALSTYASFLAISKGASFLVLFFLPFFIFGAFFAYPWSKQQPTEVWALAKVRFYLKPRKRIWDQSGAKQLVTITAPKTVSRTLTNGLSEMEVQSRLKALADTIDTRGWAVKNVGVSPAAGQFGTFAYASSDRLVSPEAVMPQEVPAYDTTAVQDVLDAQTNPRARQLDEMMAASASAQRQKIVSEISQPQNVQAAAPLEGDASYWYLNHPVQASAYGAAAAAPAIPTAGAPTPEEMALAQQLKERPGRSQPMNGHLRTIQPISAQNSMPQPAAQTAQPMAPAFVVPAQQIPLPPVTPPLNSATLELANNNDLSVATIAREAQRLNGDPPDEVVISLR